MKNFLLPLLSFVIAACSDNESNSCFCPTLTSPESVTYEASCRRDTICFTVEGGDGIAWTASTDADWLTLEQRKGTGDGRLPVYIQQNDDERLRQATITITFDGGQGEELTVLCTQRVPSENNMVYVDLPKTFGLGWGYDISSDVADVNGLRGQVFDAAALRNDYGNNAIQVENNAHTKIYYASGNSHREMQAEMGAKFAGSANIIVAKAKVSVEYSNQISEKVDRRYVWCRDLKTVKIAHFNNLDFGGDENLVRYSTTSAFRKSVSRDTPAEIVRKFGTHVVTAGYLGGKLDYYFTVAQSVKTEVERIITHINVKILFVSKSSTSIDEKVWTEIKRDFQARYEVVGGGKAGDILNQQLRDFADKNEPLENSDLFTNWSACFSNPNTAKPEDLAMVDFQIIPIWEIVQVINPTKAEAIEQYVMNTYLKE